MALDTSIALQAKTPEINPLAQMLQVAQYKSLTQNTNQLQQAMGANSAVSRAIQNRTGPDGKVDMAGVQSDLSQDPAAAYNLQAATGTNLEQQGKQTQNAGAALKLSDDQQQHLAQQFGTLLAKPEVSYADAVHMAATAGATYGLPPTVVQQSIAGIPTDPSQIKPYLQARLASIQGPSQQLGTMTPTPTQVDNGATKSYVDTNPISNPGIVGTNIDNRLPPSVATQRLPTVNTQGAPGSIPLSSTVPQGLLPPSMQGQAQAQPQASGNGRYPQASQQGAQPQQGGFVASGLAPGVGAAAEVAGSGSGSQLVADSASAAGSGARVYQLQSALKSLNDAGTVGPGTATANSYKSFLLAMTPGDLGKYLPGIDPQKIASFDEANKYLTQYAQAKATSMGAGTNDKLASALSANASTHISDLAAKDVVKANIGLERMSQAQNAAWNASGLPESQYRTWSAKFGASMDPRVFVADQLDPAHVKKLYSGMPPKEQAQFKAQYNWAVQNQYISGPQ